MERETLANEPDIRMSGRNRENWVDCGKLIGNLFVVLLHSKEAFDLSNTGWNISIIAVTFLLFLSGYTAYYSASHYFARETRPPVIAEILRRFGTILMPYAAATFALLVVENHGFQLEKYVDALLHFNANGVFYFVFIYCQLTALSPALFLVIRRFGALGRTARIVCHTAFLALLLGFSYFSVHYTYMLPLFSGGRLLFGGTFLVVYYAGMLFACVKRPQRTPKRHAATAGLCLVLCAFFVWFLNRFGYLMEDWIGCAFGAGYNPPGITLSLYCACFVGLVYSLCGWLETIPGTLGSGIVRACAWCGRYAMYIFLYHRLLQNVPLSYLTIENPVMLRIVHILVLMGAPILFGWLWSRVKRFFRYA